MGFPAGLNGVAQPVSLSSAKLVPVGIGSGKLGDGSCLFDRFRQISQRA